MKSISAELENELNLLKIFSSKLETSEGIDKDEQNWLINLTAKFKDSSKEEIHNYFAGMLSSKECGVFYNFKENIGNLTGIIEFLQDNKMPTKDAIRNYFFGGKYIDKLLFSDTYRNVLEYIQSDLKNAVKAEMLTDLKVYFEYGCYDEDLSDPDFKKIIDNPNSSRKEIYEAIMDMSFKRNIGVKAIINNRTDERTVEVFGDYLNKNGIAKSGFVDLVKMTPKGVVIALTTADGKIHSDTEKNELENHISCIYYGILKNEFNFLHNGEKINISLSDIFDIKFCVLTEFTSEIHRGLQEKLINLGINHEKLTFLNSCMLPYIKSKNIGDEFKRIVSCEGYACIGANNNELNNLDSYIINDLINLTERKNEIINLYENGAASWISKYFSKMQDFIDKASRIIHIGNIDLFCSTVEEFADTFSKQRLISKSELSPVFDKDDLIRVRSKLVNGFKEEQIANENYQMKLYKERAEETEAINNKLKELGVVEYKILYKIFYNNAYSNRDKKSMQYYAIKLGKEKKHNKKINLTAEERAYIENNKDFAKSIICLDDNSSFDIQVSQRGRHPEEIKDIIERIITKDPSRRIKPI